MTTYASVIMGRRWLNMSLLALVAVLCFHIFLGDTVARLSGVAALCLWFAFSPNDDRRAKLFLCSLLIFIMSIAVVPVLAFANASNPLKYDLYLHAIDHALGFCPAQVAVRLLLVSHLWKLTVGFYQLIPAMMVAGYGWALYGNGNQNRLLVSYAISALCAVLYLIVPASGPGFLMGAAIAQPHPSPAIALVPLNYVANCIPSAHLSTAILIWFFNRDNKVAGSASLVFVFITAFATMALGEHYMIDLVMSFPFALFVISAVIKQYARALVSFGVLILWLVAIRLEIGHLIAHPVILWTTALATSVASIQQIYSRMLPVLAVTLSVSKPEAQTVV
jgi:PAP2 superfamily